MIPINPGANDIPGGLWAGFRDGGSNGNPNTLYFTDGINGEMHGLFGAIQRPRTFDLDDDAGRIRRLRSCRPAPTRVAIADRLNGADHVAERGRRGLTIPELLTLRARGIAT